MKILILIRGCVISSVQEGTAPLNLYVEDEFFRSSHGGVGGVKSITNYAPVKQLYNTSFILDHYANQCTYISLFLGFKSARQSKK